MPRISFLDGRLELTSPSRDHERIAAWIARLVFDVDVLCSFLDRPLLGAAKREHRAALRRR